MNQGDQFSGCGNSALPFGFFLAHIHDAVFLLDIRAINFSQRVNHQIGNLAGTLLQGSEKREITVEVSVDDDQIRLVIGKQFDAQTRRGSGYDFAKFLWRHSGLGFVSRILGEKSA